MQIIKKLLFLFKSNAPINIFCIFLLSKVLNFFKKREIKFRKKAHKEYLKKKTISEDYFSSHAYNFYEVLKKYNNLKYLEIGSFEGNSAIFVAKNFKNCSIYCVDNWVGTEEYTDVNFLSVEKKFDDNVKEFQNIKKFKTNSDNFFEYNNLFYDVIYVDGHHKGFQVYKDIRNAFNYLSLNGTLILDDYLWKFYEDIKDNPCFVINCFLRKIRKKIKILKVSNSQLFLKKVKV